MPSRRFPVLNERATLYRMYWDEMMTRNEIARSIGCSEGSVYTAMRALDIPSRPRGIKRSETVRYPRLWDREWLYARYWEDGMYQREIASLLGCSVATVIQAMRMQHIGTRPYPSPVAYEGRAVFDEARGRYVMEAKE